MLNEGNLIHNFISSSGSDFLTSYSSGSAIQKVLVPTVQVPVPQHQCCGSGSGSVLDPYSIGSVDPDPGGQK
jgi:hypothetical protein